MSVPVKGTSENAGLWPSTVTTAPIRDEALGLNHIKLDWKWMGL